MSRQADPLYDVFISYSPEDQAWVHDWLLPRLEATNLRVAIDFRDFVVGMPRIENIERAIENSRRTVVVLTPEWLDSEWNAFEALLLRAADPAARRRKLLPLLLKPCDLPKTITALKLEPADFRQSKNWERQFKRLRRDIEDTIPVPFPLTKEGAGGLWQWKRWLRRYRRELLRGIVLAFGLWLVFSIVLQLPPFQPRLVWEAESLTATDATVLYRTETSLLVGGANTQEGCNHPHKGLWYRPIESDDAWQDSDVGDLLCIENRDPPALSDIVDIGTHPSQPKTIYVLTSHTGLLASSDGGARFERRFANLPTLEPDNTPILLVVSGQQSPVFWMATEKSGLFVYSNERWSRLDGQARGGCDGLPTLSVKSLFVVGETVLIGSDRRGLWASLDGGHTCQQVFDSGGRYEFYGLWDVSPNTHKRYLALVHDWELEPGGALGIWQLLNLCPRPDSCEPLNWRQEPNPVWHESTVVDDVVAQRNAAGDYEWYLVTVFGQVWQGDLRGSEPKHLASINQCLAILCDADFAPDELDGVPYLLAGGRVHKYVQSDWWRFFLP